MRRDNPKGGDYVVDRAALDEAVRAVCEANCRNHLSAAVLADAKMAKEQGLNQTDWVQCWTWRICRDQASPASARREAVRELRDARLWPW